MRMLAGHVLPGDLSVEMAINGFPIGNNYHRFVSYVDEDDVFVESLSVFQAVLFEAASAIDVKGVDVKQDLALRVRSILNMLELDGIADTRLRSVRKAGQRRRVQLAIALSTNPSLIFLDHFVSGLSGSEALVLTIQLRKLASEGRTIVCNLVDPRAEVLELFDTILVLTGGRSAYFGNLDSFHSFANRHEYVEQISRCAIEPIFSLMCVYSLVLSCGIPPDMNLATFLSRQTIHAHTNSKMALRSQRSNSWRRSAVRPQSQFSPGRGSPSSQLLGLGSDSTQSGRASKIAANDESKDNIDSMPRLNPKSPRRHFSDGQRLLSKLAAAYENSPEAYENNSIVTAVIDGTLQDMPRAPDLFMRTKSSFPNGTWMQVGATVP